MLKLSGEALMGKKDFGIDLETINSITNQISYVFNRGIKISLVVGGGNIFRGISASSDGMDRSSADYTGMMATVINSLILQNSLEQKGIPTRVLSAIKMDTVCESYIRRRAIRHVEKRRIVIFAAGTGNPFFTTDTAAALRAAELSSDIILMAKNGVDGVYDKDPKKYEDATMFESLSQEDLLSKKLGVMDQTAASICRENKIDVIVFNLNVKGNIKKAVMQEAIGTHVRWEESHE